MVLRSTDSAPYDFRTQSIGLKSVFNARDLGGYVLPGGKRVRKGFLLRGGAFDVLSDEDCERLVTDFHLAKVFDFRTSMEVDRLPDRAVPGSTRIWLPAFDESKGTMEKVSLPQKAYEDLKNWLVIHAREPRVQKVAREMYPGLVMNDFTRMQYAGFFQNILNTESGAVYWHCSQGKDRTGFAAALMLAALGADRELIMKDYVISNEFYLSELEEAFSKVETEGEKEAILTFIGVNCDYFAASLDMVEAECGSLMGFLTGPLCLTDTDIEILRKRYLE